MSELALTDRESRRLKSLEDQIGRSAGDMYDAMRAIHDEKLYRDEYSTWEEYCAKRWNMSRRNADRLIEHGRVMALLGEDDGKPDPLGPVSERVTREVSGLPDDKKVEVLKAVASESKAKNNGKPKVTAASVREKVQQARPVKATAALPESYVDDAGAVVPESLFPVWRERDTYMRICDDLKSLAGEIRELGKTAAGKGCNAIAREVDEAGKALALCMPSVVHGRTWRSIGEAK